MDARITKSRLANMLSYDWLKIICGIVAAVLVLLVLFTTIKPRPRDNQNFAIYGYQELKESAGASEFVAEMFSRGVFSYDIADAKLENFGTGRYSGMAFSARRAAGQGTVMFTTTNPTEEGDTVLGSFAGGGSASLVLDVERYLTDCENYLIRFFGENWREGPLNEAEALSCFLKRNGKDNRFRKEERRQEGIASEQRRLEKLREDFLYVLSAFGDKTLEFAYTTDENGNSRASAIALGKLRGLGKLFYYLDETETGSVQSTQNICMVLFKNDKDAGAPADMVENDLRYEAISFLRYLCEKLGT